MRRTKTDNNPSIRRHVTASSIHCPLRTRTCDVHEKNPHWIVTEPCADNTVNCNSIVVLVSKDNKNTLPSGILLLLPSMYTHISSDKPGKSPTRTTPFQRTKGAMVGIDVVAVVVAVVDPPLLVPFVVAFNVLVVLGARLVAVVDVTNGDIVVTAEPPPKTDIRSTSVMFKPSGSNVSV